MSSHVISGGLIWRNLQFSLLGWKLIRKGAFRRGPIRGFTVFFSLIVWLVYLNYRTAIIEISRPNLTHTSVV